MEAQVHKSSSRGVADHGWLKSHHSFSFANYYNPERMGFGALRVINDDVVAPSRGFGTHPHRDMEIISIPLSGALRHKDTMGNDFVIRKGEVQAMSAGTGVAHSEYNNSETEETNFLQIWVIPEKLGTSPQYSQKAFDPKERQGKFQLVVSPDGRENSVQIGQQAFFSLVNLEEGKELSYKKYNSQNGVYFFIIDGSLDILNQQLKRRDGFGYKGEADLTLKATSKSEVLLMEVPLFE
jgi:hypothetical protein